MTSTSIEKMLGNLIGGFIVILVGTSLIGPVADAVYGTTHYYNGTTWLDNPNVSAAETTILGLTTLFFALSIVTAGISIAAIGLRQAGLV